MPLQESRSPLISDHQYACVTATEEMDMQVINNGLAHADAVPTADVAAIVQDAVDSVEFISGPPDSQWGRLRAAMGRPEPWNLTYFAIGNEVQVPLWAANQAQAFRACCATLE